MSIGQVIELIKISFKIDRVFTDLDVSLEFNAAYHQLKIYREGGRMIAAIVSRPLATVPGYPDGKPHPLPM